MSRPRTKTPTVSLAERRGRFYAQWWEAGHAKRVSLRTSDRETAKRRLEDFKAGRGEGAPPEQPTIGQILDGYLTDRLPRVAAPQTIAHACAALHEHLGKLSPEALTRERSRWYAKVRRDQGRRGASGRGQALSVGTVIRELVTLRAALKWALRERWIAEAPYVEVPRAPAPRDRWLTRDEAERLIDAAGSDHLRLFIVLGLHTAGRKGAILEMRWEQADFLRGTIALGQGVGNKRRATVPMTPTARAALLEAAQGRVIDHVIEFRGKPVQSVNNAFHAAVKRAGLTGSVTPHTLRHTAATWMVQGGTPFEVVAKFLGDSVEMVERVYGHHSPEWLRQAVKALEG